MKTLSELTHIHGFQLLMLSPASRAERPHTTSASLLPSHINDLGISGGNRLRGKQALQCHHFSGPSLKLNSANLKTEALYNYNEINKDHTWFSTISPSYNK